MLTKNELATEIQEITGIKTGLVKHVLDALAEVACDEIAAGEDFVVPGLAKLSYRYTKPQKKGERWLKGDTVVGFGGVESVKDSDSPARKAKIRLVATPTGKVGKLKPGSKPEAQSAFIKTKAAKNIIARKG